MLKDVVKIEFYAYNRPLGSNISQNVFAGKNTKCTSVYLRSTGVIKLELLDLWFIFCQIENVTLLTNSGYFSQIVGGGISDDENITLGSSPNFLLLLCNVIVVSKRHYGDKKDMTSKVFGCSGGIPEHVPTFGWLRSMILFHFFVMSKRYFVICFSCYVFLQEFGDLLIS